MVNYYDRKRFISKSTLARLADVSPRTFRRYLASRREILNILGVSPRAQKLPPYAVRYICEDYCIDLPPELQDQQALNASPLRDIIIRSWKEEQAYLAKYKRGPHREVDADNWRRCARQPGKVSTTTGEVDNDNKGR